MSCINEQGKANIGLSRSACLPQLPITMFTTPMNFFVPKVTYEDPVAFKTFMQNALKTGKANRVYLWPLFKDFVPDNEATVYSSKALSDLKVRPGKFKNRFFFQESFCTHKAMGTHNGGNQRLIIVDNEYKGFGTYVNGTDFAGFSLSLLNTEELKINNGAEATMTAVYTVLADSRELDNNGALVDMSFITGLARLTDASIKIIGTPTSGAFSAKVYVTCDGTPISGLETADFVVKTTGGATQTFTVSEPNNDGVYEFDPGTTFSSGTVNLVSASALSLTNEAYESTGAVSFTV